MAFPRLGNTEKAQMVENLFLSLKDKSSTHQDSLVLQSSSFKIDLNY